MKSISTNLPALAALCGLMYGLVFLADAVAAHDVRHVFWAVLMLVLAAVAAFNLWENSND